MIAPAERWGLYTEREMDVTPHQAFIASQVIYAVIVVGWVLPNLISAARYVYKNRENKK